MKTRKQRSDKGRKRARYQLKIRAERKRNRDMRRNAELIERLDEAAEREPARPRKLRRLANRLQLLPENRTCYKCGKIWLKSAQWVCKPDEIPICKRCYMQGMQENANRENA